MQLTLKNKIILIFSLFLAVLISYLYVINGDFIGDDIDRIVFNPELQTYGEALFGKLRDRPLLMLIVTFISHFSDGATLYYRLFSILIHSLVAYQIYTFFQELNEKNTSAIKNEVALFCAFVFALHPLNSQSITTSIQMSVLFTGLLGILSLRYFLRGIANLKDPNFYKSLLCVFAGVLFKPNLIFLPLIFLVQHRRIQGGWKNKVVVILSYTFVSLLPPAAMYFLQKVNVQGHNSTPLTYFLVQAEVLFTYFKLMVVPYGLQFLYDFTIPKDPWTSFNWIYVAIHAGILTLAYFKLPSRLLWSLLLFFYISFIPESSFFPIDHLAFEHRTYFPLIFFVLFVGSWLVHFDLNESFKRLTTMFSVAICLLFMILNQNRNAEIKTYGLWAYNNLLHSHSMAYHNYSFSVTLAKAHNVDLVEPIVRNYLVILPNQGYETLVDIVDYYKYPEKKREYFEKFIVHLESKNTPTVAKLFLNRIIDEDFVFRNENLDDLARIEKTFAKQLPDIMQNTDRFILTGIKANYVNLAILLTQGKHEAEFKKRDIISYLRIKVYLQFYFGQNFENLESEIEQEIQKQPDKAILKDLLALLRLKKTR